MMKKQYFLILLGLGSYIKLKDLDMSKIYPGGLERDGFAGDFAFFCSDSITQSKNCLWTFLEKNP